MLIGDTAERKKRTVPGRNPKSRQLIKEVAPDFSEFYPLYAKYDFHNLKAVLKGIITVNSYQRLFLFPATVSLNDLQIAVGEKRFSLLPVPMQEPAREAYDALAHSGDGQYADLLLDRAYLESVSVFAQSQKDGFVAGFCELTVATSDLRIAARAAKTKKSQQLVELALVPCKTLDKRELVSACMMGIPALIELLQHGQYSEGAEALKQSVAQLEKWCDNAAVEYVRKAKYEAFGVGPLYQYLVNKLAEIAAVKVIYTGKHAGLPEETIRSYLRAVS